MPDDSTSPLNNGDPAAALPTALPDAEFDLDRLYATAEPLYRKAGFVVIPVDGKAPVGKGWTNRQPSAEQTAERHRKFASKAIGLLAGTSLSTGDMLAFVDVDHPALTRFAERLFGPFISAKVGAKGLTGIGRAQPGMKSAKLVGPDKKPAIELFFDTGMVVIPPSPHPSVPRYRWIGRPILAVDHAELPLITEEQVKIARAVVQSEAAWAIIEGGPDAKGHSHMLSLTSSGIAHLADNMPWLAQCLSELFAPGYDGNTREQILGMLESAKAKFSNLPRSRLYDAGPDGPVPLGYTKEGGYALLDRERQIIITCSANQLLSPQYLIGLAPSEFWGDRYPAKKGAFSPMAAGEALIASCRECGPFNSERVRGRGVWREGDRVIVNLGEPVQATRYLYLCFEPIELDTDAQFDAARLLDLLRLFNWRNPQDAMLLFGWLALAPICGVLRWRPHIFVYGPARSGKTTIHSIAATILAPLAIAADGQSSEAGIRQSLGPDSLPILLDEFESDQNATNLRNVLRLARSASSGETPVLRGTPEGKAMTFSLRATFFLCAINPRGMSEADQSRFLMLELRPPEGGEEVARTIMAEEAHLRTLGSAWCAYMVSLAHLVDQAIDRLEALIPSGQRRHRQNIAAMLGAGFVALHGRVPSEEEAKALAEEYRPAVDHHAIDLERDDALECFDHLMAYVVQDRPLGHWIATALDEKSTQRNDHTEAHRYVAMHDLRLVTSGDNPGLLIKHGSPAIERAFQHTRWEGRAWQKALHKIEGAFSPPNPVQFANSGRKERCIGIPLEYLPNALPDTEMERRLDGLHRDARTDGRP